MEGGTWYRLTYLCLGKSDTWLSNSLFHYSQGHGRVLRACGIRTGQGGPPRVSIFSFPLLELPWVCTTSSNFYLYRVHISTWFWLKPVCGVSQLPRDSEEVSERDGSQPESKWSGQIQHQSVQFVGGSVLYIFYSEINRDLRTYFSKCYGESWTPVATKKVRNRCCEGVLSTSPRTRDCTPCLVTHTSLSMCLIIYGTYIVLLIERQINTCRHRYMQSCWELRIACVYTMKFICNKVGNMLCEKGSRQQVTHSLMYYS